MSRAFEPVDVPTPQSEGRCPDCGGRLQYREGCWRCLFCGYSECSTGRVGR